MRLLRRRLLAAAGLAAGWARRLARATRAACAGFVEHHALTSASSIAYYAVVSLFPFLLLSASLLGRFAAAPAEREAAAGVLLRFFPAQVELVRTQLDAVVQASAGLGAAGVAVAAWVSLGIFRALGFGVSRAWNVEYQPGFVRRQLLALGMLSAAGLVLVLSLAWVSLGGMVASSRFPSLLEAVPALSAVVALPGRYAPMAAVMVIAGFIYAFVPNVTLRLRDVWVGSVLTGLLWQLGLTFFSWYLREIADLSLHGSITAVVTFLFWVYASAAIFLFGAEFTAAWSRGRDAGARPPA